MLNHLRPDYIVLRQGEYSAYGAIPDGRFLLDDYMEHQWFRASPQVRASLMLASKNVDLDFVVLRKR